MLVTITWDDGHTYVERFEQGKADLEAEVFGWSYKPIEVPDLLVETFWACQSALAEATRALSPYGLSETEWTNPPAQPPSWDELNARILARRAEAELEPEEDRAWEDLAAEYAHEPCDVPGCDGAHATTVDTPVGPMVVHRIVNDELYDWLTEKLTEEDR